MRMLSILPVMAALGLGACGSGSSVTAENESAESVARKVAAADIKPQPGRWESTVKFEKLDMPGMPPQAKEAMAGQLARTNSFSSCLTPEQVDRPDGGFFAGGAEGCAYDRFTMAGGRIDAAMTCDHGGMKQTMAMTGSYSQTSYDIKVSSQSEVQPGHPMTMSLAVAARRSGACDGKEDITAQDVKEMREYNEKAGR